MTQKEFWKTDDNVVHYFVKVTNFSDFLPQVPGDFSKHLSCCLQLANWQRLFFGLVFLRGEFLVVMTKVLRFADSLMNWVIDELN